MAKYWSSSYSEDTHQFGAILSRACHLRSSMVIKAQVLISDPSKGHLRSTKVTNSFFLSMSGDWSDLDMEMCLSRQCASKNMLHDLLGSRRDLDLMSTFERHHVYASMRFDKRNTSLFELFLSCALLKNYRLKTKFVKNVIFIIHNLWRLTYWTQFRSDRRRLPESFMSYILLF